MAGYGCLTVDQRATVVVFFAEINGITTTQGDCGLFFELDGHQQETLYCAFLKSLKRKVSVKEEPACSKCAVS
jgi:hypothetical protein